ncbi:MAG: hypothetical protein J7639_30405 [Paenibacillaceae bacterium]|nr:hypothetical protein [Paenibacillaceae bacterium]
MTSRRRSVIGLLLVLLVCGVFAMFVACGSKLAITDRQAAAAEPTDAAAVAVQSVKERELVLLFGALVQMDRQANLRINPSQAIGMLPLVKKAVADGELGAAEAANLQHLLTQEQLRYYNDLSDRLAARWKELAGENAIEPDSLSDEERQHMLDEIIRRNVRRGTGPPPAQSASPNEAATPDEGRSDSGMPPPFAGIRTETNIEQQLLELLESRAQT